MVLLGGAALSVSVIGSSAEYLCWWYSYASAFGSLPKWAETAHAAAVTADVLETVDALELETVALAASDSEARSIPFAKERYFSWHLQVQQSPHLHLRSEERRVGKECRL